MSHPFINLKKSSLQLFPKKKLLNFEFYNKCAKLKVGRLKRSLSINTNTQYDGRILIFSRISTFFEYIDLTSVPSTVYRFTWFRFTWFTWFTGKVYRVYHQIIFTRVRVYRTGLPGLPGYQ